jgi:hypothetical protein
MGRAGVVPGAAKYGSRARVSLLFAAISLPLVAAACLEGRAEPIVRADGGASDVGPAPQACDPSAPLPLYYRNATTSGDGTAIDFLIKVANRTGADIALRDLAIRYYFTNEITPPLQTSVYYAATCCNASRTGLEANVAVAVVEIAPISGADHYLEITFDANAGTLVAGDSVQVEVGFYGANHAQALQQANDYSYVAADTGAQAEWDACPTACAKFESCRMPVYRAGELVWGQPP